jgi:hypothetical protein
LARSVESAQSQASEASRAVSARQAEYDAFSADPDVQTLFAGGESSPIDPRSMALIEEKLSTKKNSVERLQAELSEKNTLLEAYARGFARHDENLEQALDFLNENGVQATAASTFVSETIKDTSQAQSVVESDIGRMFYGIVVQNPSDLERVKNLDKTSLRLTAPVHVSLGSHDVRAEEHDHAVLSPWSKAAFHQATLKDERAWLEEEVNGLLASLNRSLAEQETVSRLKTRLQRLLDKELDASLEDLTLRASEASERLDDLNAELVEATEGVELAKAAMEQAVDLFNASREQLKEDTRNLSLLSSHNESFKSETNKLSTFQDHEVIEDEVRALEAACEHREIEIEQWEKESDAVERPLEGLLGQRSRREVENGSIAYKTPKQAAEVDASLSLETAAAVYHRKMSDFTNENKTLENHRVELERLRAGLAAEESTFGAACDDLESRIPEFDRDGFVELAQSFAAQSADMRRLESNALSRRKDQASSELHLVAEVTGRLKGDKVIKLPDTWKSDRQGFEDLLGSLRHVHEGIGAEAANLLMEDSQFKASNLLSELQAMQEELENSKKDHEKAEDWLSTIKTETGRNPIAAAISRDQRPESDLAFDFEVPQNRQALADEVTKRSNVINSAEKEQSRKDNEFRSTKAKLVTACVERPAGGDISADTNSMLEAYLKNATGDVWFVEPTWSVRIVASLDGLRHSISEMEGDERRSLEQLQYLLTRCLSIFKRATNMRIPEKAGRFGNAQILKSTFQFGQVTEESKLMTAKQYLDEMIQRNRSEEGLVVDGANLVNGLLNRLARIEGKPDGFKFKILVPIIQNDTNDYHDLAQMKGSGGQILTSAFLLYVLTASLRNEKNGNQVGGVFLLLDNPLGAASAKELVQAQIAIAEALNIQIVIVTPSNDSDPLSCFEVINTLHLNKLGAKKVVRSEREASDVLTAHHAFYLSEAA